MKWLWGLALAGTVSATSILIATPPSSAVAQHARVTCASAAANGDVTVAFVIDFSGAAGAPDGGIVQACVAVPSGDNDAQALAALASQDGFAPPTYGSSGLLCSIARIPAHGCGEKVSGGYAYWAYWQGTPSGWNYANTGPAEDQVDPSVVQGWRWEDPGNANPSDPQPRGPTTPGPICNPPPPPTTTTSTTSTTVVPPTVTTTASSPSPSAPALKPPSTSSSAAAPARPAPPAAASPAAPNVPKVPPAGTGGEGAKPTTSPTLSAASEPPSTAGSAAFAPATPPRPRSTGGLHGRLASADGKVHPGGGGLPWLPMVAVLVLITGLGGTAVLRWRRAPSP